jgi:non-heme chloroperoxidase
MKFIENNRPFSHAKLYYEDFGTGKTAVFIHGWPLSHDMWEYQLSELPFHNIRCIAYDRRGFGRSEKPWTGYDYTNLAYDLKSVIDELHLDQVTLIGFSMGGGEVARYISMFGTAKISKIILISSVTPFMLKATDNPEGISKGIFDDMVNNMANDRPALIANIAKKFFGAPQKHISPEILQWYQMLALQASAKATKDCIRAFSETDFRKDLTRIDVPALIIHGDADRIVPIDISGRKNRALIPDSVFKMYPDAPHGLFFTDKEKLNRDIISFIHEGKVNMDKPDHPDGSLDLSETFNL